MFTARWKRCQRSSSSAGICVAMRRHVPTTGRVMRQASISDTTTTTTRLALTVAGRQPEMTPADRNGDRTPERTVALDIAGGGTIHGDLVVPEDARGIVLFAHGSGSSRHSPRNRSVARQLQR